MSTQVWQSQPVEAPRISLEFVRHQVEKLNSDIRRKHRLRYVIAIMSTALVVQAAFWHSPVQQPESFTQVLRLAAVLFLLGMVYVISQMRRRGKVVAAQKDEKVVQSLDAYRTELQRRRDYYLGAWRWSLWPIVPTIIVILVGGVLYDQRPNKLIRYALTAVWCVVAMLLGLWCQRREGQKYQCELDALASLDKS